MLAIFTQKQEGEYFLEDLTHAVKIKFYDLVKGDGKCVFLKFIGLYPENSIVLAEGFYKSDIFYVTSIIHPPIKSREKVKNYRNPDYFGGRTVISNLLQTMDEGMTVFGREVLRPLNILLPRDELQFDTLLDRRQEIEKVADSIQNNEKIEITEEDKEESMIVVISNIYLDNPGILAKLKTLLTGYEKIIPAMIVLMGEFTNKSKQDKTTLFSIFKELGILISNFPNLCKYTYWVFIPGRPI